MKKFCLIAALVLLIAAAVPVSALAAGAPAMSIVSDQKEFVEGDIATLHVEGMPEDATAVWKTSLGDVDFYESGYYAYLSYEKPGKATLTCTVTLSDKSTVVLKKSVNFIKNDFIKSCKLGRHNITESLRNCFSADVDDNSNSLRFRLKLKKGWKLKKLTYTNLSYTYYNSKKAKNGGMIASKSMITSVDFIVENKNGAKFSYVINVVKNDKTKITVGKLKSGTKLSMKLKALGAKQKLLFTYNKKNVQPQLRSFKNAKTLYSTLKYYIGSTGLKVKKNVITLTHPRFMKYTFRWINPGKGCRTD